MIWVFPHQKGCSHPDTSSKLGSSHPLEKKFTSDYKYLLKLLKEDFFWSVSGCWHFRFWISSIHYREQELREWKAFKTVYSWVWKWNCVISCAHFCLLLPPCPEPPSLLGINLTGGLSSLPERGCSPICPNPKPWEWELHIPLCS